MSYLTFRNIKWKNFLSTGDVWTEINFLTHSNTLIIGKNGSGKSTLLDTLTFVLYGKPYRNINKPTLVNSSNSKGLLVEIEFLAGSNRYNIKRGIKPNIFEIYCNGVLQNQPGDSRDYQKILEETVLRMDYKTFCQVVILGSATFVPFMQLKAADRRIVTETVCGIQLVASMLNTAKLKLADFKRKQETLKLEYEKNKAEINIIEQSRLNTLKMQREKITELELLRNAQKNECDRLTQLLVDYSKKEQELLTKLIDQSATQDKHQQLIMLAGTIQGKITKLEEELTFFHNNDACPVCQQEIAEQHKAAMIDERDPKLKKLEDGYSRLKLELDNVNKQLSEFQQIVNNISKNKQDMATVQATLQGAQNNVKYYQSEIDKQENIIQNMNLMDDVYSKAMEESTRITEERVKIADDISYYEIAVNILKDDGYKAQIIKKYLPIINNTVNKYLQAMGFHASFELNEEFKETIKSRYIDDFAYENFSEGEKQRIDMALLFAWRAVAKARGAIDTNLLVLDEIFDSSMDTTGMDCLLGIFSTMGADTNLFVISHRGDQLMDKFKNVIKFEKVKGYSRIAKDD